jgi:hypothetical protein
MLETNKKAMNILLLEFLFYKINGRDLYIAADQ